MDKLKISINFKADYVHVYEYLKNKDNISAYICKLVEADMNNEINENNLNEKVITIINKFLRENNFHISKITELEESFIKAEDKELIDKLF